MFIAFFKAKGKEVIMSSEVNGFAIKFFYLFILGFICFGSYQAWKNGYIVISINF
jgi:hypothetical protein